MGRVASYQKVKACDPFSTKRNQSGSKEYDQAPPAPSKRRRNKANDDASKALPRGVREMLSMQRRAQKRARLDDTQRSEATVSQQNRPYGVQKGAESGRDQKM